MLRGFNHIEEIRKSFPYAEGLPQRLDIPYKMKMDERVIALITEFVRHVNDTLSPIGIDGAVVGLSGGVDSVTVALLAQLAFGSERVCKVIVDYGVFDRELPSVREAKEVAQMLGGPVELISIGDIVAQYSRLSKSTSPWFLDLNLQTRLVQNAIFQVADMRSAWVISTLDRSERLLGRCTEFFYGHGEPLADLYKTEVYDLAKQLGASEAVLTRKPGCESWMWDDDLFGTTYEVIDPVLHLLTEKQFDHRDISREFGLNAEWVEKLASRVLLQQPRLSTRPLLDLRARYSRR